MKPRVTPSFVVAVVAVVLAFAGGAVAGSQIGSAQIKNNSIQGKDIKNRSLTGNEMKFESIPTAVLKRKCSGADVKVAGLCIDKYGSGPSSYQAANLDCHEDGGRLMSRDEFRILTSLPGIVWANGDISQYEFLSTHYSDGGELNPTATDYAGNLIDDASASNFWHRCVTYP